jgi:hypothetical protein
MSPSRPKTTADGPSPAGPAVPPCPEPSSPVAAREQGTPAAGMPPPAAGPDVPGAPVPGEVRADPLGTTSGALKGAGWRKAAKAGKSAQAKAQRLRAHAPRRSADPYRNAVPGARKLPPGGEKP